SSRRRHTISKRDWSSDVCSSDLHFLSHPMIDEDDAYRLASSGLVSEDDYRDIQLWYLDGNTISHWLGPFGVDGTGNLYRLIFGYGTPAARALKFYLLDDYYRDMNHML